MTTIIYVIHGSTIYIFSEIRSEGGPTEQEGLRLSNVAFKDLIYAGKPPNKRSNHMAKNDFEKIMYNIKAAVHWHPNISIKSWLAQLQFTNIWTRMTSNYLKSNLAS